MRDVEFSLAHTLHRMHSAYATAAAANINIMTATVRNFIEMALI